MAPICANKSDRKSYMNEIDGFSVLLTFPKPKANRSRKRRQFDDFSLLQGVASLRPIHSYKTACTTTRICSMCFAREENAITRKWQNQKHCPSIRVRNMENRRGPLNRRIRRYSILQQLNFGDTSYLGKWCWCWRRYPPVVYGFVGGTSQNHLLSGIWRFVKQIL